jgi:hypothetical protein
MRILLQPGHLVIYDSTFRLYIHIFKFIHQVIPWPFPKIHLYNFLLLYHYHLDIP